MGKVNKETDRKNRLKYLILIVAFIAIMLIVSTYAWFSTQRSVTIANLTGNVQVAEGLEISLNGQTWSNELDLSTLDIKTNSYNENTNIKPNELLPVSTEGNVSADPAGKTIVMYKGESSAVELEKVTKCNETQLLNTSELDYPAYIVFDVFIRDSSASDSAQNSLYLTPTSTVKVKSSGGYEEYGLQNTVRVGFAKFSGTCTYAESSDSTKVINKTVLDSSSKINQIAIWEPNANYHIDYIISNNNKINITDKASANLDGEGHFEKSTVIPTFALADGIDTTIGSGNRITNVYDWDQSYFKKQNTVKTGIDLSSVLTNDTSPTKTAETYPSNYGIVTTEKCPTVDSELGVKLTDTTAEVGQDVQVKGNTVTRFRIYVWLEGQDVDCINYASHGGGIEVNMGLQKPASASATPTTSPSV